MLGAGCFVVWNDRELLRHPELRALFGGHGLCRARLPEWDDVVAERSVQRIRHVHRQRDAELRAVCVLRRDRTVPDQLHDQRGLRFRIRLRCRRLQEAAGVGVWNRRRVRRGLLHRRGVL